MKNKYPKIITHKSVFKQGNFVSENWIVSYTTQVNLLKRICPHRTYTMYSPGEIVKNNIVCDFHGYSWNNLGIPINNSTKINCGTAQLGESGLVFLDWDEPKADWVSDLKNETGLEYSHSFKGTSTGSWLWMMDIQADLLHVVNGTIHPSFADKFKESDVTLSEGENWILQRLVNGWWLFIYPYTFIEWTPGCLSVNYTTPNNVDNEYGFRWITQFFYDPNITIEKRKEFETLEDVYKEDVSTIEKIALPYFPMKKSDSILEKHVIHFAEWVQKNKIFK